MLLLALSVANVASAAAALPAPKAALAPVPAANPAQPAPETIVAPLSNLTKELSANPAIGAKDWGRFATTTVEYAERRSRAQEPVAPKAIKDGIEAVDAGKALDANAADWESLRKKLQEYLQDQDKQNPPPQDQNKDQNKDKDKQDQNKEDQKQQDKDQQKQDQQKKESKSGDDQKKKSDQSQDEKDEQNNDKTKEDSKKDQKSAFGDMKNQPTPPPPSNETQKVGGSPEKKESEAKDADPALALPLQKLDQLKNQDSPAKLYQLMDGERKSDPKKKGKDW